MPATQLRKNNVAHVYLTPGDAFTCKTPVAVTGRRFVKVVAGGVGNHPNVGMCAAADPAVGVSHCDVIAGGELSVLTAGIVEVECGAVALTAGMRVQAGALGVAVVFAAGIALGTVTADTNPGAGTPIRLSL